MHSKKLSCLLLCQLAILYIEGKYTNFWILLLSEFCDILYDEIISMITISQIIELASFLVVGSILHGRSYVRVSNDNVIIT